eukprot:3347413-Pyramimonas_sp.AAC.1
MLCWACLRGCGGSLALGGSAEDSRVTARMRGSSACFRGASGSAWVVADGEQEVAAGLAGADVDLRFQRLPKSKAPMLLSIHQLEELDSAVRGGAEGGLRGDQHVRGAAQQDREGAPGDLAQGLAE